METGKSYVYIHRTADTGKIFYVGISHKPEYGRAYQGGQGRRSEMWKHVADKHGFTAEILFQNISEEEAEEHERQLIAKYGRRDKGEGYLVNHTDGGPGTVGQIASKLLREQSKKNCKKRAQKAREFAYRQYLNVETGIYYGIVLDASIASGLKTKHPPNLYNVTEEVFEDSWALLKPEAEKFRLRKENKKPRPYGTLNSSVILDTQTGVYYSSLRELIYYYKDIYKSLEPKVKGGGGVYNNTPFVDVSKPTYSDSYSAIKYLDRKGEKPLSRVAALSVPVLDYETGVFYDSILEASKYNRQSKSNLQSQLKGDTYNFSTMLAVDTEEYDNPYAVLEYLKNKPVFRNRKNSKKIINLETGKIYNSIVEASKDYGINKNLLFAKLKGKRPQNTPLRYFTE